MKSLFELYNLGRVIGAKKMLGIRRVHNNMIKYARGYMTSYVMSVLMNLGFFRRLKEDGEVDIRVYAEENNFDFRIFESLCEYLYSLSILEKGRSRSVYRIDSKGVALFEFSQPVFDLLHAYGPLFHNLEDLLRKKKIYGRDVFRRGEFVAKGSAGLGHYLPFPVVKDIIKGYGFRKVLDLGCGSGDFLFSLCTDENDIECYGVDISEEAIAYARKIADVTGKSGRVRLAVSDIFNLDGISTKWYDVDVLTSMYVLHEFLFDGREKALDLLRTIKKNFSDKYVIICELCKKPSDLLRKRPTAVSEHHLFHSLSNQGIVTFDEWKELFKDAGFDLLETRQFDFAEQGYFILKA